MAVLPILIFKTMSPRSKEAELSRSGILRLKKFKSLEKFLISDDNYISRNFYNYESTNFSSNKLVSEMGCQKLIKKGKPVKVFSASENRLNIKNTVTITLLAR